MNEPDMMLDSPLTPVQHAQQKGFHVFHVFETNKYNSEARFGGRIRPTKEEVAKQKCRKRSHQIITWNLQ